jgi:DHA2 family multidrug resistance protein
LLNIIEESLMSIKSDYKRYVIGAVMLVAFFELLDSTVVNVSLPDIARSFLATPEQSTWLLTSYLAANAIVLSITGWLIDLLGRKRLLLISIAGFACCSMMCGIAPSLRSLVCFRAAQGAFGATLFPAGYAIAVDSFAARHRFKATAVIGTAVTLAPTLGPAFGGWLTTQFGWPWIFYASVPFAAVSAVLILKFAPWTSNGTARPGTFDIIGFGLLCSWVTAAEIVLNNGARVGWFSSSAMLALTAVGILTLIAFIGRQLFAEYPLTDLRIFARKSYWTGVVIMATHNFVLFAAIVLLPMTVQDILHYSSLEAGVLVMPRGLGSLIGMLLASQLPAQIQGRSMLVLCLIANAGSSLWLAQFGVKAGFWDFFYPQLLAGASSAMTFVPLASMTMSGFSQSKLVHATALFGFIGSFGASAGIATAVTLRTLITRGFNVLSASDPGKPWVSPGLSTQARMLASNEVFVVLAGLTLLIVPLLLIVYAFEHKIGSETARDSEA